MISYAEASALVAAAASRLGEPRREQVALGAALYRLLAVDLVAPDALPAFDYSAMDGIAVEWHDQEQTWDLVGEVAAGSVATRGLHKGQALSIMTGAPLCPGADTVIPSEDLQRDGDKISLRPKVMVHQGQFIRRRGEEVAQGATILRRGTRMMPGQIALAAACGHASLSVYAPLKIGILATGSELMPIDGILPPGKIRASNLTTLLALVAGLGHQPVDLGLIADDGAALTARLQGLLAGDLDIVLTTGGVCDGKYDLLPKLLTQLGVVQRFWKVRMKPGKSIFFGEYLKDANPKLVFALPGNPVSAYICAQLFLSTLFTAFFGSRSGAASVRAQLLDELSKDDDKRHFLRGCLLSQTDAGIPRVAALKNQASSDLAGLARADCLIVLEEGKFHLKAEELVTCIML